ncbi:MAG TPA: dihydrodipicolinate synthase family protein, partial [Thermoplasmata archaeon]|nr:dihydrodipicolinate synthase family protein [Thermoplasmata archaeon]
CPNVVGVKEATGSDAYGREVRRLVRSEFSILSGDDARTSDLMRDPEVRAEGVISVLSNVFPGTLATWVEALRSGDGTSDGVASRVRALTPLLSLVTIETSEETPGGVVRVRARNPVPVKSMMRILGLPAGRCRPPLGRLTPGACTVVVDALRKANADCPELFDEIEAAFGVSVADRLADPPSWQGVAYDD